MKTRPIHNSGSKSAKRSTSKVKSIVEWIRTGGKNNKEAIERIEKGLRDHFQHKVHQKNERKGQYSILHNETMRQTALSGFISLKNDLY